MKKQNIMKTSGSITLILLLSLCLFSVSCTKEWLKPEPKSFFSPDNVYIDKAGFEALIVTMKKDLKMECYDQMNDLVMDFCTTDLGSPWSQLDFKKLTPNSDQYYRFLTMFTAVYTAIKNTNVLISRIDNITWENQADRNLLLAEAYWFRSYWYYRLVNSYGDVPFIGKEITEAKLDFQSHSRWAILDKIQSDMEFAVQWLPETAKPGDVTKGAGNHLLAKIYLANLEFDKAIEAATAVINGPYALMTDRFGSWKDDPRRNVIWDLHRPENFSLPENTEAIMNTIDRFEAPSDAKSPGLFTMRMYGPAWHQSKVLDSEGKPGMVQSGPEYDTLGRGNANIRLDYFYTYNLWTYQAETWKNTPDLRRSDINWIETYEYLYNNPTSVDYGKSFNPAYLATPLDTFYNMYAVPQYILFVPQGDPNERPMGGNGDWYIFRLADTYLLRAEAYFWKNQMGEAANDINKVRERAHATPITSAEVNIDFIFDERARELMAEEPRHSELVRVSFIMAKLNLNGYTLDGFSDKSYYYDRVMARNETYTKKPTLLGNTADLLPYHILWPIPQDVITANTKGVINQNIGYVGADNNIPPLEVIE
jgi:hypothetical protein